LPTTINYTGQRLDGSGLVYMNARYYDPLVGMFISPDTIVPDAGVLIDYNRFAYVRGNPLSNVDPSGHQTIALPGQNQWLTDINDGIIRGGGGGSLVLGAPLASDLAARWADKTSAMAHWLLSSQNANASQGADASSNSGNTGSPNGWDPNDPFKSFRNVGLQNKDIYDLRSAVLRNNPRFSLEKAYKHAQYMQQKNIRISGHALENIQERGFSVEQVANVYNRATGLGTKLYESGGNYVVFAKNQKLAVFIDQSTREIATVMYRATPQNTWTDVAISNISTWLPLQ